MHVIIIEDEKPSARRLQRMLEKLNIEANAMLHSVEESIEWFQNNNHPDLIFLDIQLSDGLSFEIFETLEITSAVRLTFLIRAISPKNCPLPIVAIGFPSFTISTS